MNTSGNVGNTGLLSRRWRHSWRAWAVVAVTAPAAAGASPPVSGAGTYDEGKALGHRNAEILFERLKLRTVDTQGCGAIPKLESDLVRVASTIHPPVGSADSLVRGFYRGYQEEIREGLRRVRRGCGSVRRSSGTFSGTYFGALTCSAASQGARIELVPLWESWEEDRESSLQECVESARAVLWGCSDSLSPDTALFESSVEEACWASGVES